MKATLTAPPEATPAAPPVQETVSEFPQAKGIISYDDLAEMSPYHQLIYIAWEALRQEANSHRHNMVRIAYEAIKAARDCRLDGDAEGFDEEPDESG